MNELLPISEQHIQSRIFTIRGLQVMLDRDLAELYQVETKALNQAVKRNADRFPEDFMFQLSKQEFEDWKSQIVTSNGDRMGLRRPPYAFTESGVSMLASVLKSETAVRVSVEIVRAFVHMRRWIADNAAVFHRLNTIEQKQRLTDTRLDKVFEAIEAREIKPRQGIFFDGQVFDAYAFVSDLIKSADKSIVLIDNYVDESTLVLLAKRKAGCSATIYTHTFSKSLQLDLQKHNAQYPPIEIKIFRQSHDRFLILDNHTVYHFGASLKDLGKKMFAFSRFDKEALDVLRRLP
jgi:hypothetical protein